MILNHRFDHCGSGRAIVHSIALGHVPTFDELQVWVAELQRFWAVRGRIDGL
jgi:hypothetical protein